MHPGLVAQPAVGALPAHGEDGLLHRARNSLREAHQFHRPAAALGKPAVHAHEVGAEQPRLVPPRPGADLHDRGAVLHGIGGNQCGTESGGLGLQAPFQRRDLLLREFRHFGVGGLGEQLPRLPEFPLEGAHLPPGLDGAGQPGAFAPQLPQEIRVAHHLGVREPALHGPQALLGLGDALGQAGVDDGLHGWVGEGC